MSADHDDASRRTGKRRFLDLTSPGPTIIGAGTVVEGNLRGAGPFVISGEVRGDGDLGGDLHVAATGSWHGDIHARRAVVVGTVIGSLRVEGKLEIGHTAVIRGTVSAQTVAIAKGSVVDGEIQVTSGGPVEQFEEKRGAAK